MENKDMKIIALVTAFVSILQSSTAYAFTFNAKQTNILEWEAAYSCETNMLEGQISRGGGCGSHEYIISISRDSDDPKTALISLQDKTDDYCEAGFIHHFAIYLGYMGRIETIIVNNDKIDISCPSLPVPETKIQSN